MARNARGWAVVLVPVDRRMRPYRTRVATTDALGKFSLAVPPGDYYAFAVLQSEDRIYYDQDFPERNSGSAKRVSIPSGQKVTLTLDPLLLPN